MSLTANISIRRKYLNINISHDNLIFTDYVHKCTFFFTQSLICGDNDTYFSEARCLTLNFNVQDDISALNHYISLEFFCNYELPATFLHYDL